MFCEYKEILGKVKKGVHSYRVFDIAIFDVVMTILGAYLLHLFIPQSNFFVILVSLFLLGIAMHRVFCVRTTVDKMLFIPVKI